MKRYQDIVGDGGSGVLEQVTRQRARITDGLAGVRHLVAVGSGKGGVGKSTLTLHLAGALRAKGLKVAILDADFNGPSQARMAGVQGAVFVPPPSAEGFGVASGRHKVALPRTRNGIGVFSMGSMIAESEALEFESVAQGESHTWRATREFALLGEILESFEWGALDLLLFDLPPGAERTVQYADFLGPFDVAQGRPRVSFLLVTIPSEVARGVVARSVAALSKGPNRLLGYVENMSGTTVATATPSSRFFSGRSGPAGRAPGAPEVPDLEIPCLGTVPFDPELARHCDQGIPLAELPETPVGRALEQIAQRLLDSLESPASADASHELRLGKTAGKEPPPMKFLCVPCDSKMTLQTVAPPEGGSLSVVYSCPECGYEIAMLTNPFETQLVQSLGVRIGPDRLRADGASADQAEASAEAVSKCPFTAMIPTTEGARPGQAGEPIPVRWTSSAEARLANIPAFVRPMARTGIEQFARERGALEVDEKILDAARDFFGM